MKASSAVVVRLLLPGRSVLTDDGKWVVVGLPSIGIFNFFYISPSILQKIYGSQIFLQNYTSSIVGDGNDLPPCPMALPRGTIAPATVVGHGVGVQSVFKKL
jgi:hypothetical protein